SLGGERNALPGFLPCEMAGGGQPAEYAALFQSSSSNIGLADACPQRHAGRTEFALCHQYWADLQSASTSASRAGDQSASDRVDRGARSAGSECLLIVL